MAVLALTAGAFVLIATDRHDVTIVALQRADEAIKKLKDRARLLVLDQSYEPRGAYGSRALAILSNAAAVSTPIAASIAHELGVRPNRWCWRSCSVRTSAT